MEPATHDGGPVVALIRVRTYEVDGFGHVNNAVYLNYLEEARSVLLSHLGLAFADFARHGVQLVIAEAHVRYIRPARQGDVLAVAVSCRDARSASLTFDYALTHQATGETIADAWTRGAFVHATTGKPVRAPALFRDAFTRYAAG